MALAITINHVDMRGGSKLCKIYGSIVPSGSYTAGGDTFNLLGASFLAPGGMFPPINSSNVPANVDINGQAGFAYSYVPGATLSAGKLKVFTGAAAQAALTELTAGAYPGGVSGDSITFELVVPR